MGNERAHALLSASSAHRWLKCPPSAIASEAYKEETSEFALEGTIAHEVAEMVASGRELENIDGADREMYDHADEYRDYIQEHVKSEDVTVLLEQRVDFSPWVPEGFGTCDCILIQDTTLTIIDYKYGVGVPVSAVDNPQMRLYALGALNDFGIAYDIEKVETHIFQPRIDNISYDTLTADELLAWGEEIKPIAIKASQGKGKYQAGGHCKFCPHAGRCRALTKTCTEFVETHDLRVRVPVLAPHEIGEVLDMEPLISLWLKRVKGLALSALMEGREIPGHKLVEGKLGNRKWTDEEAVMAKLSHEGYSPDDYTETKLLSPAGMDKVLGKKHAQELLADLIERSAGAPTIAPESDKRPRYNPLEVAQNDFK